ncbi:MAG: hypothetical protein PUF72_10735 [Clostridiales bacterium]|nr:hypothetical protein [Clostridiales bacterium]
MNYIWCAMILVSLVCAAANGRLDTTLNAAMAGAGESVKVLLSFAGVMCMWTGFLKIAEKSSFSKILEKILSLPVRLLFPKAPQNAKNYIAMNMSANLLGMGNAATPMGIKAMGELDGANKNPKRPSKDMCMLVAVNTTSLQLVPSTVMALRAAAGSSAPAQIILPVWIASAAGFLCAVMFVKIFIRD